MPENTQDPQKVLGLFLERLKSRDESLTTIKYDGESTESEAVLPLHRDGDVDENSLWWGSDLPLTDMIQAVMHHPNISRFTLHACPLGDVVEALMEALATLPKLEHVRLSKVRLSADTTRMLAESLPWKTLQTLDLELNPKLGPRGAKSIAPNLRLAEHLQILDLSTTAMGESGAQAIGSCLPTSLTHLYLSHNAMGRDGVWKLAGRLATLSHLKYLDLSHNKCLDDGCLVIAQSIKNMKSLKILKLAGNEIGTVGLQGLVAQLNRLPGQSTDDEDAAIETDDNDDENSNQKSILELEELHLSENKIDDIGASALAAVLPSSSLYILDLSSNQIGDSGCTALAKGLAFNMEDDEEAEDTIPIPASRVRTLKLSDNLIGDEGAGAFVEHLDYMQYLEDLDLTENPSISTARTRILEMLWKHRQQQQNGNGSGPALSAGRAMTSPMGKRSTSATAADITSPSLKSIQQQDLSSSSYKEDPIEVVGREEEIEEAIDNGRELLSGVLDEDNEDIHPVVALPKHYVLHLTNNWSVHRIISYGTFGPMFQADDKDETEDVLEGNLVLVRKLEMGDAGPLRAVREAVLSEVVDGYEHDNFLPLVAKTVSNSSSVVCLVYDATQLTSLRDMLANKDLRKTLTWKDRVAILLGVAKALDCLHTGRANASDRTLKPSFHGDISPSNIFVGRDENSRVFAQLADCGLSRLLATDRKRFLPGDVVFGSRAYRCPRYERGSCPYDVSSDMFSFGTVVSEVIMGRLQRSEQPMEAGESENGKSGNMLWDVLYDSIMAQSSIRTDPLAGPITTAAMETLGKISVSCLSPMVNKRPAPSTVVHLLKHIEL